LQQPTRVVRNDRLTVQAALDDAPTAIVISPGPCTPADAGVSIELVRACIGHVPLLGICLGHQAIAAALGARVIRSDQPMHGRSSQITHDGQGEFTGLPNPLVAGRYHSLVVAEATLPDELFVSARSEDGTIMGLRHRSHPVIGWQFHPESILTENGQPLLQGFLRLATSETASHKQTPSPDNWLARP
jgi:anthranilate synthase/aminodeoxychorismate synthase-like glutamine amidotransferase